MQTVNLDLDSSVEIIEVKEGHKTNIRVKMDVNDFDIGKHDLNNDIICDYFKPPTYLHNPLEF